MEKKSIPYHLSNMAEAHIHGHVWLPVEVALLMMWKLIEVAGLIQSKWAIQAFCKSNPRVSRGKEMGYYSMAKSYSLFQPSGAWLLVTEDKTECRDQLKKVAVKTWQSISRQCLWQRTFTPNIKSNFVKTSWITPESMHFTLVWFEMHCRDVLR